jgi:hypothetical protein
MPELRTACSGLRKRSRLVIQVCEVVQVCLVCGWLIVAKLVTVGVVFKYSTNKVMEARFLSRRASFGMTLGLPINLAQGVAQFLLKSGEEFLVRIDKTLGVFLAVRGIRIRRSANYTASGRCRLTPF